MGPPEASGRLLLLEAMGPGPYQSALERRGSGLHHIALRTADLPRFTQEIKGSGWYLHPESIHSLTAYDTLWLARPGVPFLVEVMGGLKADAVLPAPFITQAQLPMPDGGTHRLSALGLGSVLQAALNQAAEFIIQGRPYSVAALSSEWRPT